MRLESIKCPIFNLKKQELHPSLFNANMHFRNYHALKCRKHINFGCGGGGGVPGWGFQLIAYKIT